MGDDVKYLQDKSGLLVPDLRVRRYQRGFINPGVGFWGRSSGSGGGDPHWANVLSLLRFNGTNGSNTITDEVSGSTWTANGTAALSNAALPYAGSTTSLHLPGTSGSYVASGNAAIYWAQMIVSSASWTVDFLFRVPSIPGASQTIFDLGGVSTSGRGTCLLITSSGNFNFGWANNVGGSYICHITSGTVVANTFTLCSIEFISTVGANGTVYLYQDGALLGSAAISTAAAGGNPSNTLNIGRYVGGNSLFLNGYAGQARFTQAVARYGGASFTPPTGYYTNHA